MSPVKDYPYVYLSLEEIVPTSQLGAVNISVGLMNLIFWLASGSKGTRNSVMHSWKKLMGMTTSCTIDNMTHHKRL